MFTARVAPGAGARAWFAPRRETILVNLFDDWMRIRQALRWSLRLTTGKKTAHKLQVDMVLGSMAPGLDALSRVQLQFLAKKHGIRATQKTADLVVELRKVAAVAACGGGFSAEQTGKECLPVPRIDGSRLSGTR
jgi:hypothetical protein